MRRHLRKSGRTRDRDGADVSLFPFLAVLISTMGALILLLVVFARQAQLQAAQAARDQSAEVTQQQEDLERARGMAAWEKDELKKSREKTEAQLAEARLSLGHIEDHTRRLGEEFARLEAAWTELDRCETEGDERHEQYRAQLAEIESKIDLARRKLDQTRDGAELRKRSYAVIPYQGPNGTRRRPIYIECRSDSVVLQPEGIVLTAEDFVGPMGPGNPLEAALRAVREHILRTESGQNGERPAEPYPLLLVRPSGIEAYIHARAAMKSWGSDFGYELIEDDWKVEFDEPDLELARQVAEVVAAARRKLAVLARAVPSHYGGYQAPTYVVRPHRGGVMRIGGHGGETGDTSQPSGGTGWGKTPASLPATPADHIGGNAGPNKTRSGIPAGTNAGHNPLRGDGRRESGLTRATPVTQKDLETHAPGVERFQPKTLNGRPGIGQDKSSGVSGALGSGQENASAANGSAPRPGEWIPQPTSSESSQSSGPRGEGPARPLAEIRGKNWALPDAANGSVGITRPIRVNCYPDRLELVPNTSQARGKVAVALGDRTEDTVDTFTSAVWDHMKSWGIAGRGMYWQPILNVQVAPGAEGRFAELKRLFDGSGLEVKRREGTGIEN
jgi:hypothetical protein